LIVLAACLGAFALAPAVAAAGTMKWSAPRQIDGQAGGTSIDAVTCASSTLCVAVDDTGTVLSGAPGSPVATWTRAAVPGLAGVEGIVCPSGGLCVVAAKNGLAVSTDPTGAASAWTFDELLSVGQIYAVSCPSTSFCAAVDQNGDAITSSNPTGGAGAWTVTNIRAGTPLFGVSCPTTTFCAAVTGSSVLTSTNPDGPGATWTATDEGAVAFDAISCPSVNLCVGTDAEGDALSSTQPTNLTVPWTKVLADFKLANQTLSISCTSAGFCAFTDDTGNIVTSSNPTGPQSAWTITPISSFDAIDSISCLAGADCVAGDEHGDLLSSAQPAAGTRSAWTRSAVNGPTITAISCTSHAFCVAGDGVGNTLSSSNPAHGATPWPAVPVGHRNGLITALSGLACPSKKLCVATFAEDVTSESGGFSLSTRTPTSSLRHSWKPIAASDIGSVGVACASSSLCAVVNTKKQLFTSSQPAKGKTWHRASIGSQRLGVVCPRRGRCLDIHGSCPSRSLCVDVANGAKGEIAFSANPAAGAHTWKTAAIDSGSELTSVSCVSAHLCVAVDSSGNVLTATHPAGDSWAASHLDAFALTAVGCSRDGFCLLGDANGNAIAGRST
jgi:hypothetical protein